ncbi:RNA 2',3'-cyclic phosphodiesterase [candidate division KSB1 bacterium]|nr:RNA 2',3'-cyclic phosphodiesterase [candidate division KSB1 bacterium]
MKIRTFVCIDIPAVIREKLAHLQDELKPLGRGVSYTRPAGIHLTLKFLGDVEAVRIDEIARGVQIAAGGINAFPIQLKDVGAFPNFRRPRVFWVGVHEPSGRLSQLQNNIEVELDALGWAREQRPFSPHLTVGRVKSFQNMEEIIEKFQAHSFPQQQFIAAEVTVMRSELKPSGAEYTPLKIIKLKE